MPIAQEVYNARELADALISAKRGQRWLMSVDADCGASAQLPTRNELADTQNRARLAEACFAHAAACMSRVAERLTEETSRA